MGKSSAPPAPDYEAAAVAQGQENRETARFNAGANRVNQYTPQGSSVWTLRPGADLDNPQPGDYIQTTTLSPEQQRIYDQTAMIDNALLRVASGQLGRVAETFNTPLDLSGLPAWRTSGQGMPTGQAVGGYRSPTPGMMQGVAQGMMQGMSPMTGGMPQSPGGAGMAQSLQGASAAMGRIDPNISLISRMPAGGLVSSGGQASADQPTAGAPSGGMQALINALAQRRQA